MKKRHKSSKTRPLPRCAAVEKYHDRVAGIYDEMYAGSPYWQFLEELSWRRIKRYLPRDMQAHVLDLGCGTGTWGLKLARSGYHVTMVDISQKMLDRARGKAAQLSLDPARLTWVKSDLTDLAELAPRYSLALAMGEPLSLVSDIRLALRAIERVLQPQGLLIATVDHRPAGLAHYVAHNDLDQLLHFVQTGQTHWLTKDPQQRFPVKMFLAAELRTIFQQSGLPLIKIMARPVLPLRQYPQLLSSKANWGRLLRLEQTLAEDPNYWGLSSHLELVAQKVPADTLTSS